MVSNILVTKSKEMKPAGTKSVVASKLKKTPSTWDMIKSAMETMPNKKYCSRPKLLSCICSSNNLLSEKIRPRMNSVLKMRSKKGDIIQLKGSFKLPKQLPENKKKLTKAKITESATVKVAKPTKKIEGKMSSKAKEEKGVKAQVKKAMKPTIKKVVSSAKKNTTLANAAAKTEGKKLSATDKSSTNKSAGSSSKRKLTVKSANKSIKKEVISTKSAKSKSTNIATSSKSDLDTTHKKEIKSNVAAASSKTKSGNKAIND